MAQANAGNLQPFYMEKVNSQRRFFCSPAWQAHHIFQNVGVSVQLPQKAKRCLEWSLEQDQNPEMLNSLPSMGRLVRHEGDPFAELSVDIPQTSFFLSFRVGIKKGHQLCGLIFFLLFFAFFLISLLAKQVESCGIAFQERGKKKEEQRLLFLPMSSKKKKKETKKSKEA